MHRRLVRTLGVFLAGTLLYCGACSDGGTGATGPGGATSSSTSTGEGGGKGAMLDEKVLDVKLVLAGTTLTITVNDGSTPVATDAWLYTLKGGALTPLTGFQDPDSPRPHRGLLLPCTVGKAATGFVPCDSGELNGVMTDGVHDMLDKGTKKTAIDGIVKVTLDAAPTDSIVVVVAREDQRYAGAAGIDLDGNAVALPANVGAPESHLAVTYTWDIKPMIQSLCTSCHADGLVAGDFPLDTYDNVVSFDFHHHEVIEVCTAATPGDQAAIDACTLANSETEYMVEGGNPALSPLIHRSRPDEKKSVSAIGVKWWGNDTGARFDDTGDRRMPSLNTTADPADDKAGPTYFDGDPAAFKKLWDWVAQGAVK